MPLSSIKSEKGEVSQRKGSLEIIKSIELDEETKSCTFSYEEDGEKVSGSFEYHAKKTTLREELTGELAKTKGAEFREFGRKFEQLGLADMGFAIYTRRNQREAALEKGEKMDPPNVYILGHGWTGTKDIYSEIPMETQMSMVEAIMEQDPDAIVVTMDGNGFGDSPFRTEVLEDEALLKEKIRPESYADQIQFLSEEVLGVPLEEVSYVGHSMGGAAAFELSTRGCGSCVALSPAAFPTEELLGEAEVISRKSKNLLQEALNKLGSIKGLNLSTLVYEVLGTSVRFGEAFGQISSQAEKISEAVVGQVFELLSNYLLGAELDPETRKALVGIHKSQLTAQRFPAVSNAILELKEGMPLEDFAENSENLIVFQGESDVLVRPEDLKRTAASVLVKTLESSQWDENDPAVKKIVVLVEQLLDESQIVTGGHYAQVYNPTVPKVVASMHPNKRS
ncbi:hypothetical protein GF360_03225 [candidate division WWE3 bacterium]|nr:hypothetical protein [candidate division WWE3 bacterium]